MAKLCAYHKGKQSVYYDCNIFIIGLGRTATRSVCCAVWLLGYHVRHGLGLCTECEADAIKKFFQHSTDFELYRYCECTADVPPIHWQQLAEEKQDAKFILTLRPVDSWKCSWDRKKARSDKRLEDALSSKVGWSTVNALHHFGMVVYDREIWVSAYEEHNRSVLDYFKGDSRLLVLKPWEESDSDLWNKLASFLGKEDSIPDLPFPVVQRGARWTMPNGRQIEMTHGVPRYTRNRSVK